MTDDLTTHRISPWVKALLAAVTVTFLLLALLYWQSDRRADRMDSRADNLVADRAAQAEVIDELASGLDATRSQLLELGETPDAPDPDVTVREVIREVGATGATGSQGIQGVAGRDGRDGITPACWFEESQCVGPKGDKGDPPSMADLDAAIARYCEAHNQCKGDQGEPGADSTVAGPRGEKGDQGDPGPACPPGYEPRVMETGPYAGWIACAPVG